MRSQPENWFIERLLFLLRDNVDGEMVNYTESQHILQLNKQTEIVTRKSSVIFHYSMSYEAEPTIYLKYFLITHIWTMIFAVMQSKIVVQPSQ